MHVENHYANGRLQFPALDFFSPLTQHPRKTGETKRVVCSTYTACYVYTSIP